jgi:hypothetical protein
VLTRRNALPPLPPTGRCEPPSGSLLLRLPRLPDAARLARLQWLRLEHPDQLKAMRLEPNASGAVPAFTALHFCIPCVVIWLVTEFQLTMPELLRPTKRGEMLGGSVKAGAAARHVPQCSTDIW